jgi:hypothetical protein
MSVVYDLKDWSFTAEFLVLNAMLALTASSLSHTMSHIIGSFVPSYKYDIGIMIIVVMIFIIIFYILNRYVFPDYDLVDVLQKKNGFDNKNYYYSMSPRYF